MTQNLSFEDVSPKLSAECISAINTFGFIKMTPVQASTIPLFLTNKDVCVEATTGNNQFYIKILHLSIGSGKTLAFGIPIFEILKDKVSSLKKYDVGSLVIAPTRELAAQIYDVLSVLSTYFLSINCSLFVGGTSVTDCVLDFLSNGLLFVNLHADHLLALTGATIVVGTPGRIIDIWF